jgi:hypothetical protein
VSGLFRLGVSHFNRVSRFCYVAYDLTRSVRLDFDGEFHEDVAGLQERAVLPDGFPNKDIHPIRSVPARKRGDRTRIRRSLRSVPARKRGDRTRITSDAPYVRSPLGSGGTGRTRAAFTAGCVRRGPLGAADGGVRLARRGATSVVGTLGRDALRRSPAMRAPSSAALVTVGVRTRSSTRVGFSGGSPGSNPPEPQLAVH